MFIPGLHLFTALPVTIQRVGPVLRGQGMRRENSSWRVKLCRLSHSSKLQQLLLLNGP